MGGSSLTAEVVARAYGATSLHVLDSTDPAAVLDAEGTAPRDRTLFLVVSKSGTTVETLALYRYFAARARPEQVVVVTDPGTPLEALARERGLRAVFPRSEEHTSELQSRLHLVCRLLLEKKKKTIRQNVHAQSIG